MTRTASMALHHRLLLALALLPVSTAGAVAPQDTAAVRAAPYPHASEPIGTVRQMYDGTLTPPLAANTFRNIDRLFPTRRVPRAPHASPLPDAANRLPQIRFMDHGRRYDLAEYLELNRVAGLLVLEDGKVVLERYRLGNSARTRWMSMSIAKSITSTLIGAAIRDGRIHALSDPVVQYVPSLAGSGYDGVTVRDVLMMASGVRWNETYTDSFSDRRRLLEAQIAQVPGGAMDVMKALPRVAAPGTVNNYNTGETQVAAEVVRHAVGRPLADYLEDRIWRPFGMEADANWWLDSPDGVEIGGSGFSATLRDYGRFGLFVLGGGLADGRQVLPPGWVAEATGPTQLRGGKPLDYGYLWWTGTSDVSRRDHAFSAEGIHGQFLYINPAVRLVIVVWSAQPAPLGGSIVDDWSFFEAVADALRHEGATGTSRSVHQDPVPVRRDRHGPGPGE
jgi:CubicO group peptidase (beta-lactamase class C family)